MAQGGPAGVDVWLRLVEHLTRQRADTLAASLTAGPGWRRVEPAGVPR
ncbi:hypothetical protein ACFQ29_20805 [Longispora fulva]